MTDPEREALRLVVELCDTACAHLRASVDNMETGLRAVRRMLDMASLMSAPDDGEGH